MSGASANMTDSSDFGNVVYDDGFVSLPNIEGEESTVHVTLTGIWNTSNLELSTKPNLRPDQPDTLNNWWAMLAVVLVIGTATGNILVCVAIAWERRLQNVTNYFLMSLAVTDLMVAILVMPLGILTLVRGFFPLPSVYCLAWICLDVLFCTASIMHLCTISVDRYLSLRYPMKFGRNKTRKRVILKIVFVWLLSIAMSLPLSLMYSKDDDSVLVDGTCQIPDPLYKLIGSIICFYIPLGVMLLTYALTVRLLAKQKQSIGGGGSSSATAALERRCTWKRLLHNKSVGGSSGTPQHTSGASTDTELTTLDTHELWLPESEPPPSAVSAIHAFGAEMLKLSRGLANSDNQAQQQHHQPAQRTTQFHHQLPAHRHQQFYPRRQTPPRLRCSFRNGSNESANSSASGSRTSLSITTDIETTRYPGKNRRRASTYNETYLERANSPSPTTPRKRSFSFHEQVTLGKSSIKRHAGTPLIDESRNKESQDEDEDEEGEEEEGEEEDERDDIRTRSGRKSPDEEHTLPPRCTCPFFGKSSKTAAGVNSGEIRIVCSEEHRPARRTEESSEKGRGEKGSEGSSSAVVTWRGGRRGSSIGSTRTLLVPSRATPLRRAATMRAHNGATAVSLATKSDSSPSCLLRYSSGTMRTHHSRTSSIISRNSSRHGRIIRLEQKATKVLGVVFFTFVILWAPFFVLNLVPAVCPECERKIDHKIFDLVTWLGYASSMVNPIFYTIFNKVFRQAFKKVLMCQYRNRNWRPPPPPPR